MKLALIFHRKHSLQKSIIKKLSPKINVKNIKLECNTYVDYSQDRQGRLVRVRTVVAATCINIYSQVAQRNEDLIACSHVSRNSLNRKAAYTGWEVEMFYT